MDKRLLGMAWGLPTAFALPSVASCRRALARIGPRLVQLQAATSGRRERRRWPRLSHPVPIGPY